MIFAARQCRTSLPVSLTIFLALSLITSVSFAQDLRTRLKVAAAAQSEPELLKIESSSPRAEEAALAKLTRGYLRLQAKDYNGALAALDETVIARQSRLGDYAIYYRGQALQGAGQIEEAEKAYFRLAQTYPTSLLARVATLQAAGSAMQRSAYQSVVNYVEKLAAANDGTALKFKADALEKMPGCRR